MHARDLENLKKRDNNISLDSWPVFIGTSVMFNPIEGMGGVGREYVYTKALPQ